MDGKATNSVSTFQPADFAVFGAILSISCFIGIYFAWKDKNDNSMDGYFLAGRSMNPIAVGMSMLVTYSSSIGFISDPAETYIVGDMMFWSSIARLLALIPTVVYFIPAFRRLDMRTIVQYLGMRFNTATRRLAAIMGTLASLFYSGLVAYVTAATLSAVTPISINWSIVITSVVCVFYTSLGGMKAVIWTDAVQMFFMVGGLLAIFIKGMITVGGFENFHSALEMGQRYTFSRATGFNMVVGTLFATATIAVGLVLYAIFSRCDPVYSGRIRSIDQIVPFATLYLFHDSPGMTGLFVAAVFSAALSTISSNLNSSSIVVVQEFLCVFWQRLRTSERLKVLMGKIIVVVLGLIIMGIAFAASLSRSNIVQLLASGAGILTGPIAGLYLLGFFFPRANSPGASVGLLLSFGFGVFLFIGNEFLKTVYPENVPPRFMYGCPSANNSVTITSVERTVVQTTAMPKVERTPLQNLYNLNFNLFILIGMLLTVVVGYIVSLFTGPQKPADLDPKLFIPLVDNKRLPTSVRKFFRFGVPERNQDEQVKSEIGDTILEDKL